MVTTLDELFNAANTSARQGDWSAAIEYLQQAVELDPENPQALSALGTCRLQAGLADQAISAFQKVVDLQPGLAEAHNNLGVAWLSAGQPPQASAAFEQSVALDQGNKQAWRNLALAYLQQERYTEGVPVLAALLQADPGDVQAAYLLGQCYQLAGDTDSARTMYRQVLQRQPDHAQARQGLAELAPAPVVDVSRIARPVHAQKLAALKKLKLNGKPQYAAAAPPPQVLPAVAFYGPPLAHTEVRLGPAARALQAEGRQVKVSLRVDSADIEQYQTFVFANPHLSSELIPEVVRLSEAGKRVIIDLDRAFHDLPEGWPGYHEFGPGNPAALRDLEKLLSKAALVTAPTQTLADRYAAFAPQVEVVPYTINQANLLWEKPAPTRNTFNLGLVGMHTTPGDAAMLKPVLAQVLAEFPETLLVFAGALELYRVFDNVPEERKLVLPPGRIEDYPYLLAHIDLLLLPYQDNAYNRALSELPLMEAGLRRIPWVATPIPAFEAWGEGGMFAEESEDWLVYLQNCGQQPEEYKSLGIASHQAFENQDAQHTKNRWPNLFA